MKRVAKRIVSLMLAAVMVFGAAPLAGFVGLELPNIFDTKAEAAEFISGYYTYTVSNGEATITDCDESISGDVTIPSTLGGYLVTCIGDNAFDYCTELVNIIIPDSITSIGYYAFDYCISLTDIAIPNNVTNIGYGTFNRCKNLSIISVDSGNKYYSSDSSGVLFNKNKTVLIQYPIGSLRENYRIPNGVEEIELFAFDYCENITNIYIPSSVYYISDSVFYSCIGLESITVASDSEYYSSIDGVLFDNTKTELVCYPAGSTRTSYSIPDGVERIEVLAFACCVNLEDVHIPNSVVSIGENAFMGSCFDKKSENWQNGALYVDNCLVETDWNIESSFSIKEGTTLIADSAFNNKFITSVTIPDSVKHIGAGAFIGCTELKRINIPNSVETVGGHAFTETAYYNDNKNWNKEILYIDNWLICADYDISGTCEIQSGTKGIADYAFEDCDNLTYIQLVGSLETIGKCAFLGCLLLECIDFESKIYNIGEAAFFGCETLKYAHIPSNVTSIGLEAFEYTSAYICSDTENCYAKTYADENEIEFKICDGSHSIPADPDTPDTPDVPDTPDEPEEPSENVTTGTMENLGITYDYEYSDEFFENSSYEYNHDLATMSICLAISAMVENGSYNEDEPESAKKLMEEIGYGNNLTPYNYDKEPEQDSIACIIGSKNIPETDETVIAIAIRGAGYTNEWAGNFNVGDSKTHDGFKKAKNKVMSYLCSFIEENKETFNGSVKYWVTGFSRSAATANLVAAELDEIAENHDVGFVEWWNGWKTIIELNFEPSDVYAYTFETPMNTTSDDASDKLYKNIFNIINRNDLVPYVAPAEWGYDRFGIDCELPSAEKTDDYKDFKDRMSESYEKITDGLTYEEEFQYFETVFEADVWYEPVLEMRENKSMHQSAFLDEFVEILADDIIESRETYIDKYQAPVMELAAFTMGTKGYEWNFNFLDFLKNLGESIKDKWLSLAFDVVTGSYLKGIVSAALSAACGNVDLSASDIYEVLDELEGIFDGLASNFDTTYTLILNAVKTVPTTEKPDGESRLFYTHNPAVCLAWMDAIDGELVEVEYSNMKMFEDDVYRILAKLPSLPSDIKKLEEKVDYVLNNPSFLLTLQDRKVLEQYKQESQITRTYRKVIFNCPVNISVYDKNGALRASIVDDIVQYVPDGYISTYINPDGEKVFCLPNDGEYTFKITGTDSGMLNCSVVDFDADLRQNVTGSNYYNIPVENGTQITGFLETRTADELKSKSNFEFANGTDIPVSEVIDYTTEEEYTVTVESSSEASNVAGGGKYYKGEFAKVTAYPGENEYFAGWYVDGKCVSYEAEYRFMVTTDCTITAKYHPSNEWKVDIDNSKSVIYKGEFTLTPTISPAPVNAKIVYSSSDTSVATVDENGNVTAVGTGTAVITARVDGTEIYDYCEVKVSYAWWQWIIRILLLGFLWY